MSATLDSDNVLEDSPIVKDSSSSTEKNEEPNNISLQDNEAPDGGRDAWLSVVCWWCANFVTFGWLQSVGKCSFNFAISKCMISDLTSGPASLTDVVTQVCGKLTTNAISSGAILTRKSPGSRR
jgi:hypothetical protein